ncbi:hypothetical protein N864_11320 [Intrasporangium chromatireducens Q5-1]|uniref:Exonuclease domain-containing protein n=1 Tax=Intrasporangium chromatireducens Q5-1 TaxID=584657 RepID=W9GHD3_9MICO|nr:3'-5' exonuclease [Intrasporangium chromatireducens]EWT04567.1 hypothetical protein N864_11320 [Intrasporangium chromatireducens Q5-1]
MSTTRSLTDPQFELFEQLTARPFLVLDTEYCRDPDGDGDRLISLALVPVVRGRRRSATVGELYVEMNPGVPIDAATRAVHGFTDADVARKRRFAFHVGKVLAALARPDAILVAHTGADVRVLRRELERLDEAAQATGRLAPTGLADLPDLPIIDTSTLPRLLRYPGIGNRSVISLADLCRLTGVRNPQAHHARADARTTADVLIQLLIEAARNFTYRDLPSLLAAHDRGTTHTPKLPQYLTGRGLAQRGPGAAHLSRHMSPMVHAATAGEIDDWLGRALECSRLRCPHLRTEAALAAPANGTAILDLLIALLPQLTEPGQPGTLLGAVDALLTGSGPATDPPSKPALAFSRALRWWSQQRARVVASVPCSSLGRCPDCQAAAGCPRDLLYQPVTRIATLGERHVLDVSAIKDRLFGNRSDRRVHAWSERHPRETAYMTWLVATWSVEHDRDDAPFIDVAISKNIHHLEPRLALLACQRIAETHAYTTAKAVADTCLEHASTDPAYDELRLWTTWHEQAAARAAKAQAARVITHPRLARPPGRVHPNPYLPQP